MCYINIYNTYIYIIYYILHIIYILLIIYYITQILCVNILYRYSLNTVYIYIYLKQLEPFVDGIAIALTARYAKAHPFSTTAERSSICSSSKRVTSQTSA